MPLTQLPELTAVVELWLKLKSCAVPWAWIWKDTEHINSYAARRSWNPKGSLSLLRCLCSVWVTEPSFSCGHESCEAGRSVLPGWPHSFLYLSFSTCEMGRLIFFTAALHCLQKKEQGAKTRTLQSSAVIFVTTCVFSFKTDRNIFMETEDRGERRPDESAVHSYFVRQ